jgi:putative RecB family exonuclease
MLRGNFVHLVLEYLLTHEPDDRTPDAAKASFSRAQAEFVERDDFTSLALADDELASFWEDSRNHVRAYYRIENPRSARIEGLERHVEADLGDLAVHGIVDRIERDDLGRLIVTDYKTGKPKPERFSTDYARQLQLYALMCEQSLGIAPDEVRLFFLGGSLEQIPPAQRVVRWSSTVDSRRRVRDEAVDTHRRIAASCTTGEFATQTSPLCDWCDYKPWCPAWGGEPERAIAEAPVVLRRREAVPRG